MLIPSRSDLVVQSSPFDVTVGNCEILNLSMVSGPIFSKIKGTNLICTLSGVNKRNNKTEKFNKVDPSVVPGALNDTNKIRRAGADIYRAGTVNQ